jgi:hypothetical protein
MNLKPPPSPDPVAETFEVELKSINDKGKDLKGEQKVFYNSIVERVANNVQVLADLRAEHTALRAKLRGLIKEKEEKTERVDLAGDIRHSSHEVNLMRSQIDHIKKDRVRSVERQQELAIIQENFRQAEIYSHPEEALICDKRNELDRVKVKNEEALHLMKIYHSISYQFDRQKMRHAPTDRNKRAEIAAQNRDISELTLVSRDSRYACTCAKNDYFRAKADVHEASKKRRDHLESKKAQVITDQQSFDTETTKIPTKASSINAQPSVLRNKLNKAAREKREERYRTVSAIHASVRDAFGTNNPDKIFAMFQERRHTNATLSKQIEDLKVECREFQAISDRLQSQCDEAEYASAKGVGGNRMLREGLAILDGKKGEKKKADRELEAVAQHQKAVVSGCYHLQDILALVDTSEDHPEMQPHEILMKCQQKIDEVMAALDNEDQEYLEIVNKTVFAVQKLKEDAAMEGPEREKKVPRTTIGKRQKDAKLDVVTRVLDRNAVKALAQKTLLLQAQSSKKIAKPK